MTTNQTRKTKPNDSAKDSSRDLLLEARENAINAKETAMEAAGRVREKSNKLDETLARILDEAERRIQKRTVKKQLIVPEAQDNSFPDEPIDIYPEIKRKTVNSEIGRRQQLEQLIHDITEEKAQQKTEALNEETRIYKAEAQRAMNEAEKAKKTAQAAIRKAREEASKYREETETANKDARIAISLAQERVKAASEEIQAIQQQAQNEINLARADILKAKEEAEITRRQSRKAVSRAEAESQKAREEAEVAKKTAAEIILKAQEDISKTRQVTEEPGRSETSDYLLAQLTEMHNPLHSISGFARMILDDNICDRVAQKEFVRSILQQSENLKIQLDNIHCSLKSSRG